MELQLFVAISQFKIFTFASCISLISPSRIFSSLKKTRFCHFYLIYLHYYLSTQRDTHMYKCVLFRYTHICLCVYMYTETYECKHTLISIISNISFKGPSLNLSCTWKALSNISLNSLGKKDSATTTFVHILLQITSLVLGGKSSQFL